jgi:hypothetical protein
VTQFVQIGETHLLAVDGLVTLGVIPDVLKKEQDLGWEGLRITGIGVMGRADEEAENVGFPALKKNVLIGVGFVAHGNPQGRFANVGRKAALGGLNDVSGDGGELSAVNLGGATLERKSRASAAKTLQGASAASGAYWGNSVERSNRS